MGLVLIQTMGLMLVQTVGSVLVQKVGCVLVRSVGWVLEQQIIGSSLVLQTRGPTSVVHWVLLSEDATTKSVAYVPQSCDAMLTRILSLTTVPQSLWFPSVQSLMATVNLSLSSSIDLLDVVQSLGLSLTNEER